MFGHTFLILNFTLYPNQLQNYSTKHEYFCFKIGCWIRCRGEQDIVVVFFLLAKAIFSNFKTKQKGCVDA
jgi:hypothetical protein